MTPPREYSQERSLASRRSDTELGKLQALVYDIIPPTTDTTDYAIGLDKMSANKQFFLGAQIAVRLQQTTHIISGVSFITACDVYVGTNKTKSSEFLLGLNVLRWHRTYQGQAHLNCDDEMWSLMSSD